MKKSDLDVQVKGRTIRLSGEKTVGYPETAALHRRERLAGRFDRAVTMPIEINPEGVKAEYREGILAVFLPRAESDKPKSIKVASYCWIHSRRWRAFSRRLTPIEQALGSTRALAAAVPIRRSTCSAKAMTSSLSPSFPGWS